MLILIEGVLDFYRWYGSRVVHERAFYCLREDSLLSTSRLMTQLAFLEKGKGTESQICYFRAIMEDFLTSTET